MDAPLIDNEKEVLDQELSLIDSIEQLMARLTELGYDNLKKISGNRIAILTNENRIDILNALVEQLPGAIYDTVPSSASSIGSVVYGPFQIFAKPASKQGNNSIGIQNEYALVDAINKYIKISKEDAIDVTFIAKHGLDKLEIEGVVNVEAVGTATQGHKKADVNIITDSGAVIPLSLKKDNAQYWESAGATWGGVARKMIDQLKEIDAIKFIKTEMGYYVVSPNFAVKATEQEARFVIFGTDIISNNGAIIIKTFSDADFQWDENINTLTIDVSDIYQNVDDVEEDHQVWFLVRNDKCRNSKAIGYPGIRAVAAYKSRINPNVLTVEREQS